MTFCNVLHVDPGEIVDLILPKTALDAHIRRMKQASPLHQANHPTKRPVSAQTAARIRKKNGPTESFGTVMRSGA